MSSNTKSWWAHTPGAAKRTAFGGAVLVLALAVTSGAVWSSPGSVERPLTAQEQLAAVEAENASLRAELEEVTAEAQAEAPRALTPRLTPTPTPTPTPEPVPVPVPVPDEVRKVVVVKRDSPVQPRPAAPSTPAPKPAPAAITAPAKAALINPDQRYFGMYTTQAPFNFATFDDAAMKAGTRQSMVGYFGGWDQPFRSDAVTRSWERGLLPMLTWESRPIHAPNSEVNAPAYSLPLIIGDIESGVPGAYDDYLRQYARDIVTTGLPLGVRLNHEMNGVWYPWSEADGQGNSINGNSRGDYVKMWRHVHDIFEAEGANQFVIWTWAPNIINNLPSNNKSVEFLSALYPGDEYVDWVGVSGYLRPSIDKKLSTWTYPHDQTWSFDYTFGRTLEQLRQVADKPIILAEIGASEYGAHKPEWVTSLFGAFSKPENADIVGFNWFNLAVTTIGFDDQKQEVPLTNDWRIDSRANSLAAFKNGLAAPESNFVLKPY